MRDIVPYDTDHGDRPALRSIYVQPMRLQRLLEAILQGQRAVYQPLAMRQAFSVGVRFLELMTIAETAKQVLIETNNNGVMWGDCFLLDDIAVRCKHTNLMTLHPLVRHQRILNALEKSPLFEKRVVWLKRGYQGNQTGRCFTLKNS